MTALSDNVPVTCKVPALIVVKPVKVLAPDNSNVPAPDFVKAPESAIIPP